MKSINKYYFNNTYKNNFYKFELIHLEINRILDNINNYFNEIALETDIKQMILNISLNEIPVYNKEKEKN